MSVLTAGREAAPGRSTAVRRGLAGLLVAVVAALSPVLSAAPADAARLTARVAPAVTSPASTAAPVRSTDQENRRGLRPVGHRSGVSVGRRLAASTGALQQAHPLRGATVHPPTGPATGSIDATGPPSSYGVATIGPSSLRLGKSHHPATAGRAPPCSCGS